MFVLSGIDQAYPVAILLHSLAFKTLTLSLLCEALTPFHVSPSPPVTPPLTVTLSVQPVVRSPPSLPAGGVMSTGDGDGSSVLPSPGDGGSRVAASFTLELPATPLRDSHVSRGLLTDDVRRHDHVQNAVLMRGGAQVSQTGQRAVKGQVRSVENAVLSRVEIGWYL